jgi:hypothetical protein
MPELDPILNYLDRRAMPASGLLAPQPQPVAPQTPPPVAPLPQYSAPPQYTPPPVTFTPPMPPPQFGPPARMAPAPPLSQAAMQSAIGHLAHEREFTPPTTPTTPPRPMEGVPEPFRGRQRSADDVINLQDPRTIFGAGTPGWMAYDPRLATAYPYADAMDIGGPRMAGPASGAAAPTPGGLMPNRQGWLGMPWFLPRSTLDPSRGPALPGMFDLGGPSMGGAPAAGPIPPFWMQSALPAGLGEAASLLPRAFPIVPVP